MSIERENELPERPLQHEVNIQTPGAILMAERQAQGIELSEIAAKLKLSRQWLERIEADVFDGRDAFVYLRGYIRAYAQLLGLKVEAVLAALDNAYKPQLEKEVERTVLAPQPVVEQVQSHRNTRQMIRLGSMAVGLVILLSIVLWWYDQRSTAVTMPATMSLPADQSQDIPMPASTASPAVVSSTAPVAAAAPAAATSAAVSAVPASAPAAALPDTAPAAVAPAAKPAPRHAHKPDEVALPAPVESNYTVTKVTD